MTFDPDRRRDLDPDPVRRRMAEGESVGWIPGVLGILLLAGFAYMIFAGWNSEPRTTRESNVSDGLAVLAEDQVADAADLGLVGGVNGLSDQLLLGEDGIGILHQDLSGHGCLGRRCRLRAWRALRRRCLRHRLRSKS